MRESIYTETIESAKRVGQLELLRRLVYAVKVDWTATDMMAWARTQMEATDPLDEYLNKPEAPQCQHIHTYGKGPELVCGLCHETVINLDGERAAQEDERRG